MRKAVFFAGLAALVHALGVLAAPPQQTDRVSVGPFPSTLAVDAASGKVVIGSAGAGRGAAGALAVLERDGKLTTVATPSGVAHVSLSVSLRTAVAVQPGDNRATLLDIDTMRYASVPTGSNPTRSVIVEKTGHAYVLGRTTEMTMAGGVPSTTSNGFITVIDLRTQASQVYPMPGFAPEELAASADGTRLYVIGSHFVRGGEYKPGFVQAFDTVNRVAIGTPTRIGRVPQQVMASTNGAQVYVVGHADYFRSDLPAEDLRRHSVRPALFVLDAASLALQRTIDLPDTKNLDLLGPTSSGQAAIDRATGRIHVLDRNNARLTAIDPTAGTLRTTELEAPAHSFALNPASGTIVVTLNGIGQAAILSRNGTRLDTVPIGRAPLAGEPLAQYAAAVDGATGDTYITNGHDHSISVLHRPAAPGAVVNLTDVWFDPADPGWGLFVDQQGIVLFATLFIHDARGDPTWLAMSNGLRQPDGSFSGVLYRTRGPAPRALADIAPVGIMRITPDSAGAIKLLYVADGQSHTRVLQRLELGSGGRACAWGVGSAKSAAGASNFTSLWSDPREPGWGVAISHQGRTAFGVLFHYDAESRPSWSVMSNGREQDAGLFTGELYRARRGRAEPVGTLSLDFSGSDAGTIAYRVDGTTFRASIARNAMTSLTTRCTP